MARSLVRCLLASGIFLGCGGNTFQGSDPGGVGGAGLAGSLSSGGAPGMGGQTQHLGGAPESAGAPEIGGYTASGSTSQGGSGAVASAGSSAGGSGSGGSAGSGRGGSGGSGRGGTGGQGSAGIGGMSAAGGGGLADPRCPAHAPAAASSCQAPNVACRYNFGTDCLCAQPVGTYFCQQVDPSCMFGPSSTGAGGVSAFAAPNPVPASAGNHAGAVAPVQSRLCTCSNGSWSCSIGL